MHDPLEPSRPAAPAAAATELQAQDRTQPSNSAAPAAAAATPDHPAQPARKTRWLRILLWLVLSLGLLLCASVLALWLWAGNPNSLRQLLSAVQRYVPAAQALQVSGVQGSLRNGGHIDRLRWQQPDGVSVAVDELDLAWQPLSLLHGRLLIERLQAQRVQVVNRTPTPDQPEPSQPLESLMLPVQIDVQHLALGHFGWDDPQSFAFEQLQASYHYDGAQHALRIERIELLDGEFKLDAQLGAAAPMQLHAQLDGLLRAPLPQGQAPLPLSLQASAQGPLQDFELQALAQAIATPTPTPSTEPNPGPSAAGAVVASAAPASTSSPANKPSSSTPDATALPSARLNARIQPWRAGLPLEQAQLWLHDFNLQTFQATLPQSLLSGHASLQPDGLHRLQLQADLRNAQAGAWDQQRLPLDLLQLQGDWQDDGQGRRATLQQLRLLSGDGEISGSASLLLPPEAPPAAVEQDAPTSKPQAQQPPTLPAWQADLDLQLKQLNPQTLYSSLASAPLNGSLRAHSRPANASSAPSTTPSGQASALDFAIDIHGTPPKRRGAMLWLQELFAQGAWTGDSVELKQLRLASNQARIQGQGSYNLQQQAAATQLQLTLPGANGKLNGHIAPQRGQGQLALSLSNASQTLAWLRQLPGLDKLLDGQQLRGAAHLQAQWQGGWQQPSVNGQLDVNELALYDPRANSEMMLHDSHASLRGRLDQATLELKAKGRAAGLALELDGQLQGGQTQRPQQDPGWHFNLQRLSARLQDPQAAAHQTHEMWTLETLQPWSGSWQNQTLQTSAGSARLLAPESVAQADNAPRELPIHWQAIRLRTNSQGLAELRSAGDARGLPFAWANALSGGALSNNGITGDLRLDASWDIQLNQQLKARLALERSTGDITLRSEDAANDALSLAADQVQTPPGRGTTKITLITPEGASGSHSSNSSGAARTSGPRITAGIRALSLVATASDQEVQAKLDWDSERLGHARAHLASPLKRVAGAWQWAPDAPLTGQLQAQFNRLGIWSVLAPPGWRMRGQLAVDTQIAGTRSAPLLTGTLRGSDLALRSVLDGVELSKGEFLATLQGNRMLLDHFTIEGEGGGNLKAHGQVDWNEGKAAMQMQADINKLAVTRRADRQVMVSGQLNSTLNGQQLTLTGKVGVDRARILLPESSAPTLGDDVHIVDPSRAEAEAAVEDGKTAIQPHINVTLDMGRDFQLKGYGINTELRGQLTASTPESGSAIPRITGDITTYNGEYRAYGQWLEIDHGIIRFSGAYDNPSLDILAIRPRLTERVGVQISGPAMSPVVRLYSASSMTDSEKLAWLLLGRSSSAGGAESAMLQQAAAAMLSGGSGGPGIAGAFGLDQLSVGGSQNASGETEASLTVGKQLARNLYVTYERSLSGALGTLYVFYDLSKRWTLRGESGEENAVDLIFTLPYD